jgi:hypothetical protein
LVLEKDRDTERERETDRQEGIVWKSLRERSMEILKKGLPGVVLEEQGTHTGGF